MIFAFNCVSVFLIMIEMARYSFETDILNKYFKTYCTHEREKTGLIVSHIQLLMGIAFAPTVSFIILDGGFLNSDFAIFSFTGLVFLAIGDTTACLIGREFGSSFWHSETKKTIEGSFAGWLAMYLSFYIVIIIVAPNQLDLANYLVMSCWFVALVEGVTVQYDNLVCCLVFYLTMIYLHDYFLSYN
jgi:dolichol kinase